MKTKNKRVFLFFWIAFLMYLISMLLPYIVRERQNHYGNSPFIETDNGVDTVLPLFCFLPIFFLIILVYAKHTNFTRRATLIIAFLMVFPILPFLYFVSTFTLFGKAYSGIGFYLNCISFILFLISAITKFNIPAKGNKQIQTVEVLDDDF